MDTTLSGASRSPRDKVVVACSVTNFFVAGSLDSIVRFNRSGVELLIKQLMGNSPSEGAHSGAS